MAGWQEYLIIIAIILAVSIGFGFIIYNFIWCRQNPEKCYELEKLKLQEKITRQKKGSVFTINL